MVLKVKPIDEETMDQWPVDESGLPARVVNACTKAPISTVGELRRYDRRELGTLKGMGAESISAIGHYFKTCQAIQAGTCRFRDLRALFDSLLSTVQYDILVQRYGLHVDKAGPDTLEQAGEKHKITRERARQIEEKAKEILKSRLAQACFDSIYDIFDSIIEKEHGAAPAEVIERLAPVEALAGYSPCSLLRLFCDCSSRFSVHHEFFSTLPLSTLVDIETRTREVLVSSAAPRHITDIIKALSGTPGHPDPEINRYLIMCTLRHDPDIFTTIDDRHFSGKPGTLNIIAEIMKRLPTPVQFKLVMREFNQLVLPGRRKGHGFILDLLSEESVFHRTSSGYYELVDRT